jgi:hypothetical protein
MVDPTGMMGDYYSYSGMYLGNDGKDDGKVYFATEIGRNGNNVDLDRRTIRKTTLNAVLKAQDRAVAITPGTYNPIAELASSVADNAETKSRTVRMGAAVAGVIGTCIGTAMAGCANAIQLGNEYIQAEMEDAQGDAISTENDTLVPGPFADGSIPARGPERDFTAEERRAVNDIGNSTGCHTCGSRVPGTTSGNWIPDHQPPSQLNEGGGAQQLYPHCKKCSNSQGGKVTQALRRIARKLGK